MYPCIILVNEAHSQNTNPHLNTSLNSPFKMSQGALCKCCPGCPDINLRLLLYCMQSVWHSVDGLKMLLKK